MASKPTSPRLIRRPEVERMTSLSTSELYRRIAAGTFPKQITLGTKSVAWVESEVIAWIEAAMVREGA